MARWSRQGKTVEARLVYYGPAGAGKTANLEALHRAVDTRRSHELLTVETERDGTLFFDLLPLRLDDVLGFGVELKLYSIPGQVRLDATRRVVLAGADAIVFVADSRLARREQNLWSLQNLRMNMRAKELDPARVPVLFQANRRDAADAAPLGEVASWVGVAEQALIPATASRGEGVVESLGAACRALLSCTPGPEGERPLEGTELAAALQRALAPLMERLRCAGGEGAGAPRTPIVLAGRDPLEGAIEASVRLGEQRSVEAERARRLAREAEGFSRLGEALGRGPAGTDAVALALGVAQDVLAADGVSLIAASPAGPLVLEGCAGRPTDPLLPRPAGRRLLRRLMGAGSPCVVDDVAEHGSPTEATAAPDDPRSLVAVPLPDDGRRVLVAYAGARAGSFEARDVRFLSAVARHLVAGLEQARAEQELARYREGLERNGGSVRQERRRGAGPRRAADRMRERLLASLTSEMRAAVASVEIAAAALAAAPDDGDSRGRLLQSIADGAERLDRRLDDVARLVDGDGGEPLRPTEAAPRELIDEALRLAGPAGVRVEIEPACRRGWFDVRILGRALANVIEHAVRVSPPGSRVEVRVGRSSVDAGGASVEALSVAVLDRGPVLSAEERERMFTPFARGSGRATAGAGLGVALCEARSLARRHGGRLDLVPREGGGSEFRLTLPLQPIAEGAFTEVASD